MDEVAEEEEGEVLQMFDECIDSFEHSSFRPRRLCVYYMSGRCEQGWTCKSSILTLFEEQIVDAPMPQTTDELTEDIRAGCGCASATDHGISRGRCADHTMRGCADWCARSQAEFVDLTQFILPERIVARFVDVTRASDTGTNSGSRSEHSTGTGSVAWRSRSWYASTADHGGNVEVIQLVHSHRGADRGRPSATDHGQPSRPLSSGHHTSLEHRLRRKHLLILMLVMKHI